MDRLNIARKTRRYLQPILMLLISSMMKNVAGSLIKERSLDFGDEGYFRDLNSNCVNSSNDINSLFLNFRSSYYFEGQQDQPCEFYEVIESANGNLYTMARQSYQNDRARVIFSKYNSQNDTFEWNRKIITQYPPDSMDVSDDESTFFFAWDGKKVDYSFFIFKYNTTSGGISRSSNQLNTVQDSMLSIYYSGIKDRVYSILNSRTSTSHIMSYDANSFSRGRTFEFINDYNVICMIIHNPNSQYTLVFTGGGNNIYLTEVQDRDIVDTDEDPINYSVLFTCMPNSVCEYGIKIPWVSHKVSAEEGKPEIWKIFALIEYTVNGTTQVYFVPIQVEYTPAVGEIGESSILTVERDNINRTGSESTIVNTSLTILDKKVYGIYIIKDFEDTEYISQDSEPPQSKYIIFEYDIESNNFTENFYSTSTRYTHIAFKDESIIIFGQNDNKCTISKTTFYSLENHADFSVVEYPKGLWINDFPKDSHVHSIYPPESIELRNLQRVSKISQNLNAKMELKSSRTIYSDNYNEDGKRELQTDPQIFEVTESVSCKDTLQGDGKLENEEFQMNITKTDNKNSSSCVSFCSDRKIIDITYSLLPPEGKENGRNISEIASINKEGIIIVKNKNLTPKTSTIKGRIHSKTSNPICSDFYTPITLTELDSTSTPDSTTSSLIDTSKILIITALISSITVVILTQSSPSGVFMLINQQQLLLLFLLINTNIHPDVRTYIGSTDFLIFNLEFLGDYFVKVSGSEGVIGELGSENMDVVTRNFGFESTSVVVNNRNLFLLFGAILEVQIGVFLVYWVIMGIVWGVMEVFKCCKTKKDAEIGEGTLRENYQIGSNEVNGLSGEIENSDSRDPTSQQRSLQELRPPHHLSYIQTTPTIPTPSYLTSFLNYLKSKYLKLFFSIYLVLLLEAFLGLLLTSCNEIMLNDKKADKSQISYFIAIFVLTILVLFYVFTWVYFLYHFKDYPEEANGVREDEKIKLNEKRVCGQLFEGLRGNKYARVYFPLSLTRKIFYVVIILILDLPSQQTFWSLLVLQCLYIPISIVFQNYPYKSFEFFIQQVNEVFLIFTIVYFLNHNQSDDWGIDTDNPEPKNRAITLITLNTLLVILLQLTKTVVSSLKPIISCIRSCKTKKTSPKIDETQKNPTEEAIKEPYQDSFHPDPVFRSILTHFKPEDPLPLHSNPKLNLNPDSKSSEELSYIKTPKILENSQSNQISQNLQNNQNYCSSEESKILPENKGFYKEEELEIEWDDRKTFKLRKRKERIEQIKDEEEIELEMDRSEGIQERKYKGIVERYGLRKREDSLEGLGIGGNEEDQEDKEKDEEEEEKAGMKEEIIYQKSHLVEKDQDLMKKNKDCSISKSARKEKSEEDEKNEEVKEIRKDQSLNMEPESFMEAIKSKIEPSSEPHTKPRSKSINLPSIPLQDPSPSLSPPLSPKPTQPLSPIPSTPTNLPSTSSHPQPPPPPSLPPHLSITPRPPPKTNHPFHPILTSTPALQKKSLFRPISKRPKSQGRIGRRFIKDRKDLIGKSPYKLSIKDWLGINKE